MIRFDYNNQGHKMPEENFMIGLRAGEDEMVHVLARFSPTEQRENIYTPEEAMRVARTYLHVAKAAHSGNWARRNK